MPIFTRRSLQKMLDELGPWLSRPKGDDLVNRLDNEDPNQSLPAEYELALSWGVSQVADLVVEQPVGSSAPDIFSRNLLRSGPAVAEITALNDEALSGERLMNRAANIIMNYCNSQQKRSGNHLYFQFQDESGYQVSGRDGRGQSQYFRRRKISQDFELSDEMQVRLRAWISGNPSTQPFFLQDETIDVVISWKEQVHPHGNTFSTMPSLAHDLKDNPLYKALKAKERKQLQQVPSGTARCILLGDAGCRLLRDANPMMHDIYSVSGKEIIETFLKGSSVDIVCVFTPRRQNNLALHNRDNPWLWCVYVFDARDHYPDDEHDNLKEICRLLPRPYLESHQARSWHQQGMFNPQGRGHYLPTVWTGGQTTMSVKISARALQEYLAGRLTLEQLGNWVLGDTNMFELALSRGETICSAKLELGGDEADDDYIIFEFADDPSASPLHNPKTKQDKS